MRIRHFLLVLTCMFIGSSSPLSATVLSGYLGTQSTEDYPLNTHVTDSRFQYVIPFDQICTRDTLSGISIQLSGISPDTIHNLTIRVKRAWGNDVSEIAAGNFVNDGLELMHSEAAHDLSAYEADAWVHFEFNQGAFYIEPVVAGLVIDLLVDAMASQYQTEWQIQTHDDYSAVYNTLSSSFPIHNLMNTQSGWQMNSLPQTRLHGLVNTFPAYVNNGDAISDLNGFILGDYEVLSGSVSRIAAGTRLQFGESFGLSIYGFLEAVGAEQDSIHFSGNHWKGLDFFPQTEADGAQLSHVVVENASFEEDYMAGGIHFYGSEESCHASISLVDARIRNCKSDRGGGIMVWLLDPVLQRVSIEACEASWGGGLFLSSSGSRVKDLQFLYNISTGYCGALFIGSGNEGTRFIPQAMERLLFVGNEAQWNGNAIEFSNDYGSILQDCTFTEHNDGSNSVTYARYGISYARPILRNALFYSNDCGYDFKLSNDSSLQLEYSSIEGHLEDRSFVSEGSFLHDGGNNLLHSPVMQQGTFVPVAGSPLIDAGHPACEDPDLSVSDIGCMYHDRSAPALQFVTDVPEDQGRQLQVQWAASSMDLAQTNGSWYYSLWRQDSLFADRQHLDPIVVSQDEVPAMIERGEPFTWMRDDQAWHFLASIPAIQQPLYGQVVETLADYLDGIALRTRIKVLWHAGETLSESSIVSGTSVDNVPPDPPAFLHAVASADQNLHMSWQEVATGTVNGVQLAERNPVSYRVYCGTGPWFELADATMIAETQDAMLALPLPLAEGQGFYRVVAVDQSQVQE